MSDLDEDDCVLPQIPNKHVQPFSFWWCFGSKIHDLCAWVLMPQDTFTGLTVAIDVVQFAEWSRLALETPDMKVIFWGKSWHNCKSHELPKGFLTPNEFVTFWRHCQNTCSLISHEVTSKIYFWRMDTPLSRGNKCRELFFAHQLLNFNLKCQILL